MLSLRLPLVIALAALLGSAGLLAHADERREHRGGAHAGGAPRWGHTQHHDRQSPVLAKVVATVPAGALSLRAGGGGWHHHGGPWHRPLGPRFIVSAPPLGLTLPLLPSGYIRLNVGGLPYFYANGLYYAPLPAPASGYTLVPAPAGLEVQPTVVAPPVVLPSAPVLPDPVIYPRNNQSPEQTEFDRQECNRWATTQPAALADAGVFQRAVAACMDARGYTLR